MLDAFFSRRPFPEYRATSLRARVAVIVALFAGLAILVSACGHYQLGTSGKLRFQTLYIAPVANTADIPQGAALFSAHVRQAFIRDGRVRLADAPETADATLTIELTAFNRSATTARRDDTGLARKFDLNVNAQCTLRDNRSGAALFEKRPVSAVRQIFTTPDSEATQSNQSQAEYNTMPLLAESLAERVAHAVLDTW